MSVTIDEYTDPHYIVEQNLLDAAQAQIVRATSLILDQQTRTDVVELGIDKEIIAYMRERLMAVISNNAHQAEMNLDALVVLLEKEAANMLAYLNSKDFLTNLKNAASARNPQQFKAGMAAINAGLATPVLSTYANDIQQANQLTGNALAPLTDPVLFLKKFLTLPPNLHPNDANTIQQDLITILEKQIKKIIGGNDSNDVKKELLVKFFAEFQRLCQTVNQALLVRELYQQKSDKKSTLTSSDPNLTFVNQIERSVIDSLHQAAQYGRLPTTPEATISSAMTTASNQAQTDFERRHSVQALVKTSHLVTAISEARESGKKLKLSM